MTSPEMTVALTLAGTLEFNPMTDSKLILSSLLLLIFLSRPPLPRWI